MVHPVVDCLVSSALTEEAQDTEDINKFIVDKYYENHKFSSLNEMGYGLNYGVIQIFFSSKLQETGESYNMVQDLIARHDVLKNSEFKYSDSTELYDTQSSGVAKYLSATETGKKADVVGVIKWDTKNPKLSYPVDNGKEKEILLGKNYFDMRSGEIYEKY